MRVLNEGRSKTRVGLVTAGYFHAGYASGYIVYYYLLPTFFNFYTINPTHIIVALAHTFH